MNRDIKFRGKRADNGEWVKGDLLHIIVKGRPLMFIVPKGLPCKKDTPIGKLQVEINSETIGQLTGLTDKNGKDIFEGDIIRVTEEDEDSITGNEFEHIGIVKYGCNGKFVSDYQTSFILHCKTWYKEEGLLYSVRYGYEIIGNIHDNPELK